MAKKNIPNKIDRHIRERNRPVQRIKTDDLLAVQFVPRQKNKTPLPPTPLPLQNYVYTCRFFEYERYSRQHSGSLSFTVNTLTYSHTDTGLGANSSFDEINQTWNDSTQSWTIDEWINHYLKVEGVYYKITANTANTLTIEANNTRIPDESQDYDIVPFIPNQFVGSYLVPDNTSTRRLKIISNTETIIEIELALVEEGEVTVGDSSAPYNTFTSSIFANVTDDDNWKNYSILFSTGANIDEAQPVNSFISSSGTFVTDNFTNAIAGSDRFYIRSDLLFVDVSDTFEIQAHITPVEEDFTSAPGLGNVIVKHVNSVNGEIFESNLPGYYNSIYSIELRAKDTGILPIEIDTQDSIKIGWTPIAGNVLDEQIIIHDSALQPNVVKEVSLPLNQGLWYRLDIYYYAESGAKGFRITTTLGDLVDAWRDVIPSTPTDLTATGGDHSIQLEWAQDERFRTQIWQSADDITYFWLATVDKGLNLFDHLGLDAEEQVYYKIRHMSDKGDLSTFTSSVNATAWEGGTSQNITITSANYPYVKEGDVMTIKVALGVALAANPTVELYDSVGDTAEDAVFVSQDGSDYFYTYTMAGGLNESDTFYFRVQASGLNGETFDIDTDTFTVDYTPPTLDSTKFIVDSDGVTTVLDEDVVVRSSNFIVSRNGGIIDSLAGPGILYAQPCLSSISTSVGVNQLTDVKLIDWGVGSLSGHYLIDSASVKFSISGFNPSTGVFTVTGSPSSGAYQIVKFDETDATLWQYAFNYREDDIYPALLDSGMPSDWLYTFPSTDVKYGFLITGSDNAGNIEDDLSQMALADIYFNATANIPVKYDYYFWDGSQQVFPNDNGWFNNTNLFLRIVADASPYFLDTLYYRRQVGAIWESPWQEDATGQGDSQHTYDIPLSTFTGEKLVQFYITNAQGVEINAATVAYKYDKTPPTWTIADEVAEGGFNRIGMSWSNDPVDDISGVQFINIYRATTDNFGSSILIGRTQTPTQKSYVDTTATDTNQNYYYWGKAQDFAGNEQTTEQQIDDGTGTKSVLLEAADVDGALRIVKDPDGVNWNVLYGIRVPVQAAIITAGTLSNVDYIAAIEYQETTGGSWIDVTNPKYNDQSISYPHDISTLGVNETKTITFDPIDTGIAWRVVFNHADAETEITDVSFESFLAADILIGGILRIEKGISIWTGLFNASGEVTGSGMYIDKFGLQMWDAGGLVNMQLNNDGSAVLGRTGGGQITIAIDGTITIDSELLTINSDVIFAPGYDPEKMRQVFSTQPTTPYYVDDLWLDGDDLWICITQKLTGTFNAAHWVLATTYTDDTVASQALSDAADAQSTADGKIVSYWQNTPPTGLGAIDVGDIWFDTNDGNRSWRWSGSVWEDAQDDEIAQALLDASNAQSTADGKITTFYQASPPTAEGVGDLWVDTDDGNKLYRWSGSAWVVATDETFNQNFAFYSATPPTSRPDSSSLVQGDMWYETDEGNRPWVYTGSAWQEAYTEIDGSSITTGKIESFDGFTYFDLTNNLIKVNEGIDRIIIGKIGAGVYGIKIYDDLGNKMFQIDDTTQKITSKDGLTYFDLGNNTLVINNGTLTSGTITGATIKTATGSVDRVEMDSSGLRIYNYLGGTAARFKLYHENTDRFNMLADAFATYFTNNYDLPFSFNRDVKIIGNNDLYYEGGQDRLALRVADSKTAADNNSWGTNTHVRLSGTTGTNIHRILLPENNPSQIYIVEVSSSGFYYDFQHDTADSGSFRGIYTRDGGTYRIEYNRPIMLMYSQLRGKWIVLNQES